MSTQGSTSYTRPTCDAKRDRARESGGGGEGATDSEGAAAQEFDAHWFAKESVDAVTAAKHTTEQRPVLHKSGSASAGEAKEETDTEAQGKGGRRRLDSMGLTQAFAPELGSSTSRDRDRICEGVGMAGGMSW